MRVALTGGIASGKSTVAEHLRERGVLVIDSDALAREVVEPGTEGLDRVVAAFGTQVLTPQGELDRPALGAIVFADPERRRELEQILHPLIRARSASLEASAAPGQLVVHDIPLLVETGQQELFDEVLVVDVPPEEQIRRMVSDRGATEEDARARIAAQADRDTRRAASTIVIDNSGTRDDLRHRVTEVVEDLLDRLG